MADSLELWIDTLADLFAVGDGKTGGLIKSYRLFSLNEFPGAVTSQMVPCAMSYVTGCRPEYSQGGGVELHWTGQTDFHLTQDVKPANLPYILPFFGRIIAAAAANITLSGKVHNFVIADDEQALRLVSFMAGEPPVEDHQGIVVRWLVKQIASGYTVS